MRKTYSARPIRLSGDHLLLLARSLLELVLINIWLTMADSKDTSTETPFTHPVPDPLTVEPTKPNDSNNSEEMADNTLRDPVAKHMDDEPAAEEQLRLLATSFRDQDDLERDIGRQADQMLLEQADERDGKRKEKTEREKSRWESEIRKLRQKLSQPANSNIKNKIRNDIASAEVRVDSLNEELAQIQARIDDRHKQSEESHKASQDGSKNGPLPGESRRDFLIRTGKITPFSKMAQVPVTSANLADVMLDAEGGEEMDDAEIEELMQDVMANKGPMSHRNLRRPGFMDDDLSDSSSPARPLQQAEKRRKLQTKKAARAQSVDVSGADSDDAYDPGLTDQQLATMDESDEVFAESVDDDFEYSGSSRKRKAKKPVAKKKRQHSDEYEDEDSVTVNDEEDLEGLDDGNEAVYKNRLDSWIRRRSAARRRAKSRQIKEETESEAEISDGVAAEEEEEKEPDEAEWTLPHPTLPDHALDGGFRIPGDIYPSLFDYQKIGVQWLWELYSQQVGGIVGDEMGLGKTVQIIAFVAGLHFSKMLTKPVIIVCPATVMKQWVNEFHRWWPPLRVSILHTSGSGMMDLRREDAWERELEEEGYDRTIKKPSKSHKAAKKIVERVVRDGHVLVTTYSGLQSYAEHLLPVEWGYAVLDEGHKIRNPNAGITIYCKELQTHNRIILSGTPMQNNLTELWSLFDFVFPMRLGTLVTFRQQFEFPIKQGGYANATNLAVETAMKCAEALKETISPYLLQRFKVDVAADLPKKTERVLFCRLTKLQRRAYMDFLRSDEMNAILAGKRQALYGVDILRKISNHPDLVQHKLLSKKPGYDYGNGAKSGKMQVVKALLEIWKRGGHKTLLFAQHRIMLDILETFVSRLDGFNYRRMDGNTAIKDRQAMVDEFNRNPDLHVFLLTTKVGGLGVNLTGADRVIIYDPDWNPSTDVQARERAWRLGQKREVEIYRLMTAGTIEEKIYHRQIFKQFLTNKILRDPKQRQTFALRDLQDLFTLGEEQPEGHTETSSIFKGTEVKFNGKDQSSNDSSKGVPAAEPQGVTIAPGSDLPPPPERLTKIVGVSRQEDYAPATEEASKAETSAEAGEGTETNRDDRIMSALFSRSGVHSALEHDAILASNSRKPKVSADPEIIAREARRVAAEAAAELKRAGEIARTVPAGVPTWTGTFGSAGRPEDRPPGFGRGITNGRGSFAGRGGRGGRGGPSSSSVLSNLAARQGNTSTPGTPTSNRSGASTPQQPRGREFLVLIRDYLQAHGGMVYTQNLIDHFNRYCGTPQRTAEFKEMLKKIATLEKGRNGRGRWVLKDEWRQGGASTTPLG